MNLHTIVCSTRPGRIGLAIGTWFHELATRHGRFTTRLVDLKVVNLPFLDEAAHPRLAAYEHPHTKEWSATVTAGDAFVFVTPEYNTGIPGTLKNALDFLLREWAYKPVGFVGYGGLSGGSRATMMVRPIVSVMRMMPIPEGVHLPFAGKQIADGVFQATPQNETSARAMLDELGRWAEALRPLRAPSS